MAKGLKDHIQYNAPGGLIQGTNLDAYRVANDSLRVITELKQTREELERLRALAHEFFELSERMEQGESLTSEQMWRYDQIGEEISPESYGPAPQG